MTFLSQHSVVGLMRNTFAITFLIILTAYSTTTTTRPGIVVPPNLSADEARVIVIARQFLSTNQNWPDARFERPKRSAEGGWSVLIWKLPETPDLDLLILINDAGHVTYSRIGL